MHEYQSEGPDNVAFEKARERFEESVFENGRVADTCLTLGRLCIGCLGE